MKQCKDCKGYDKHRGMCHHRANQKDEYLGTMIGTKYVHPDTCGIYEFKPKILSSLLAMFKVMLSCLYLDGGKKRYHETI